MAVLRPLKVIIENYPEGQTETLPAINHPDDPTAGTRPVTFGRELWIEADDFMEDPPKKFFRLGPGREVRMRYGYFITCVGFDRDAQGTVTALRCTYDPATKGGNAPDGRKVQGTIHWLAAADAVKAEVRLYDQLFDKPSPGAESGDVMTDLNPASITVLPDCWVEQALASAPEGEAVQFERIGYFCRDRDSTPTRPVFNRTVGLRDTWAKVQAETAPKGKPAGKR